MTFPKLYLAIDNCFATKRWTSPDDWSRIISSCGLSYIESSADTECDMLYHDKGYLRDWQKKVRDNLADKKLNLASVYTGHGTYATLGLTHTDERCRERMLCEWLFPHIDNASDLGAIAGFYCHAFDSSVLQSKSEYDRYVDILVSILKRTALRCREKGVIPSLEQMYTPNQYPWRIKDAENLIKRVSTEAPLYLTIDTGHQCGQQRFPRPTYEAVIRAIKDGCMTYVGSDEACDMLRRAIDGEIAAEAASDGILGLAEKTPHLFSEAEDSDTWEWIRRLGRYSPIIHLQQTDNNSSSHKDFSDANNAAGIITGEKLLRALYESYTSAADDGMPPPVDRIYLTLELFYPTAERNYNIIESIKTSVAYWRKFIPEDGIALDKLYRP